jgi:hypothetical protein
LRRYSLWKKALASSPSAAPLLAIITTSPPAQKPRPSAWSMITAVMFGSLRQPSSASDIVSHISRVSAWIACGRFRRSRATEPSVETRTSSLTGSLIGGAGRG